MSTVLWVRLESDPDDFVPDDLYELFAHLEALDGRCLSLGVRALTDFVDYSDMVYALSDDFEEEEAESDEDTEAEDERWLDEHAEWVDAAELLVTLNALRADLAGDEGQDQVLEEIAQVIERCDEAISNDARLRLIAVM